MSELDENIVLLVDGYNVIRSSIARFGFLKSKFPRQQRKWLLENLKQKIIEKNMFGIIPDEIFLIFDGVFFEENQATEKIKVIFTDKKKENADQRIIRIIEDMIERREEKKVYLITSDRGLVKEAKEKEGRRLILVNVDSNQFIDWLEEGKDSNEYSKS